MVGEVVWFLFFQAEDGIRDLVRSRGLGDVYKRQVCQLVEIADALAIHQNGHVFSERALIVEHVMAQACLLYTSDAADDLLCVDLGGRRIIINKTQHARHYSA